MYQCYSEPAFDQGGTTPSTLAYAINWPMCSWLCTSILRKTASDIVFLPRNRTVFVRLVFGYAPLTASSELFNQRITSAFDLTFFSKSAGISGVSSGILPPA